MRLLPRELADVADIRWNQDFVQLIPKPPLKNVSGVFSTCDPELSMLSGRDIVKESPWRNDFVVRLDDKASIIAG
ncbi:hypothetical protein GCM10012275_43630 [Longimycelium tulufanense]|uniref:Uncharacterized protein n=1 Tax=Longimycelium tulufanense TaxID=907463 RepID=A0A8J3FY35_9PSEU|nr:hypothetical protein GCM10012275_43630 [Longimycelium tulufanense]